MREPASLVRRSRPGAVGLGVAFALSLGAGAWAQQPADGGAIEIATATSGAVYHPVGNAICRLVNLDSDERPCVARLSEGSIDNLERIAAGKVGLALAQEDVVDAARTGVGAFAASGANPRLRLLMTLHPEVFAVMVGPAVSARRFEELRGLRINFGRAGAGYALTRARLVEAYGWTAAELSVGELGPAEQNAALCAGEVDAIVFMAGQPNGYMQDAALRCGAKLVAIAGPSLERLFARYPGYVATTVPGRLYAGNPEPTPTFGAQALLIATDAVAEADAYRVVKAVIERFDDFRRLHPALAGLTREGASRRAATVRLHPGAERYYREAGLVD